MRRVIKPQPMVDMAPARAEKNSQESPAYLIIHQDGTSSKPPDKARQIKMVLVRSESRVKRKTAAVSAYIVA